MVTPNEVLRFRPWIRCQIFNLLAIPDPGSDPVKSEIVTPVTFVVQTFDGRDVTCTVTREGDSKWVTVQKNKKAGGPDVR